MFALLDGPSRDGGRISRNGNPVGKAWHYTPVAAMFLQRGHVNAPSLVSCLLARLILKHASFDAYLPSAMCAPRLAPPRVCNIRLRFHCQPRIIFPQGNKANIPDERLRFTYVGGGKYVYLATSIAIGKIRHSVGPCSLETVVRVTARQSRTLSLKFQNERENLDCRANQSIIGHVSSLCRSRCVHVCPGARRTWRG